VLISYVKIENYNRISTVEIDFTALPRCVMLAGRVDGAGASSNGAGKSSVFDAIVWGLYGQEPQRPSGNRRRAGDMIREGESSVTVTVHVQLDNGKEFRVVRSRTKSGNVSITINGKDQPTASGGQERIERVLGCSYSMFVQTVVFSGVFSAFCRLSRPERSKILEEMLGIRFYLEAADAAKEKQRVIEDRLSLIRGEQAALAERRKQVHYTLRDATDAQYRWEVKQLEAAQQAVEEYHSTIQAYIAACAELDAARSTVVDRSGEYKAAMKEWAALRDKASTAMVAVADALNSAERLYAEVDSELRVAKSELAGILRANESNKCPTCNRVYDAHAKPADVTPYKDRVDRVAAQHRKRADAVSARRSEYEDAQRAVKRANGSEPEPPQDDKQVRAAQSAAESAYANMLAALTAYNRVNSEERPDYIENSVARAIGEVFDVHEKGRSDNKVVDRLQCESDVYNYWRHGFSRDGIPSYVLETAIPALNSYVKPLVDLLTDRTYHVTFSGEFTRGKAEFGINAMNSDGGSAYDDLSKGEITRIDLCVLFAIRRLMLERASIKFEQVFIDELLDGLDQTGMERAALLLRKSDIAKQVVFISHDSTLQEAADGVITLVKRNGSTTRKLKT